MRKEVVFAIIIGLFLGAVILVGWQLADQSAKQAASTTATPQTKPDPASPDTPTAQSLTITSPQNHAVVNTNSIKITGKTLPNASIAATNSEDDTIVTADIDGNFSVDLSLTGGENVIKLTVLKDDHTTDSTQITVIYTTAKIGSENVLEPITASASAIVDKVVKAALDKNLKNVQEVNLLVGYAGIINDIKLGVFNLTTDEANLQISYDSKTTIIKDGKTLKPELLPVKDKAVVIGNMSSLDILVAKRIVISSKDEIPEIEKKVIYSPIVKIRGNLLTLNIDGKSQEVTIGKKLKLDPKTLTTDSSIFGVLLPGTNGSATLLQAVVIANEVKQSI